jgi:hypothetical protein
VITHIHVTIWTLHKYLFYIKYKCTNVSNWLMICFSIWCMPSSLWVVPLHIPRIWRLYTSYYVIIIIFFFHYNSYSMLVVDCSIQSWSTDLCLSTYKKYRKFVCILCIKRQVVCRFLSSCFLPDRWHLKVLWNILCTVPGMLITMAITFICKYCGRVLDAIQILIHNIFLIMLVHFNYNLSVIQLKL